MCERLGASHRCPELLEEPVRVAKHPENERQEERALHAGWEPSRGKHVFRPGGVLIAISTPMTGDYSPALAGHRGESL